MRERAILRVGATSAILGAALGIPVNALHPRLSPNTQESLQTIAGSTIWVGEHLGILFFTLLVLGGLATLYRSIPEEPSASLARFGFVAALVGASVNAVLVGSDGIAMKRVADTWTSAPEAEKVAAFRAAYVLAQVDFGLLSVGIIFFGGVAFILYGLAVALSDAYPKWLGWVAVAGGSGSVLVGLVQAYDGPSFLVTVVLLRSFSLVIILWILVLGILMWRRAGAAS